MRDATSQLRTATRRAKSDVANKLVSMFLHELSRKVSERYPLRVESEQYESLVRSRFENKCPYCSRPLDDVNVTVEHLDGMNRLRVGLHVPGNVLVACKKCNSEKRRDDSLPELSLASTGWESFLAHDRTRCETTCLTCRYWETIWPDEGRKNANLSANVERIRAFRAEFPNFEETRHAITQALPALLAKLYTDCQAFAESEIRLLLEKFDALT